MLFTSLLVQATRALTRLADVQQRSRGARFRRGFLSAYAVRVTQRLVDARDGVQVEQQAVHGRALVPPPAGMPAPRPASGPTSGLPFGTVDSTDEPSREASW